MEAVPLDLMSGVPVGVSPLGASPGPFQESLSEMLALRFDFHSGARPCILAACLSTIRTKSLSVQFAESVLLLKNDGMNSSLFSYDVPFDERERLPSTFRLRVAVTVAVTSERPVARQLKYFVDGLQGGDRQRLGLRLAVDVVRTLEHAQQALNRQLEAH